ncbi:LOW QUALITY PROTEIN: leukocyte tyrosine kinase receptor-like [Nylanderia fulva]|uniref:LOW QUALITY PROTEIN: leukocyte tyrosine kinase receptor-like n=1 Tax=Nylanderia fulva TaxID=613905 RepID=UPI0010FB2DCE|nr:LOW QUALITY PROTEIN: leukocyte tyrosine kinase receptor-like [Nylanderia fulva]
MPKMSDERYHVEVMNITANSIVVRLPEPVLNDKCENYNLATTIYTISVGHRWNKDRSELKKFQTHERYYEIQNLSPSTEYIVKLALSNFYFDFYKLPINFDRGMILTTTSEELNAEYVAIPMLPYLSISGVVVILGCCVCIYYSQCKRSVTVQPSSTLPPSPIELIPIDTLNIEYTTLTASPIELIPIDTSNIEYTTVTALKQELQENPNIRKIKIEEILSKDELLGEGAFGIVFQGIVSNLEGLKTMCAIKRLPDNASLLEKKKFLQEAKRMSRFDHENVLKLLGICLNTDSPMLILELMETDLLTYLRENQTFNPLSAQSLRLQDLLAMCEDVARGCHYLEEMRYVHRDLACRNCLISTRNDGSHIVKISDFGLTRNMYNDQYYRMETRDPLPIRWMAPESILYQLFTSKSDVWAFGVLMWEIMSLGEFPYYHKNAINVIGYICEGNRLSQPLYCPSTLYQLMQQCWSEENNRPNFNHCLEIIVSLIRNNSRQ